MILKNTCFACLLLLLSWFAHSLRADPVISPPVEQDGLRFETWLASPKIVIPDKGMSYRKNTPATLFSVRVTNLTPSLLRINPYALSLKLVGPNGKELFANPLIIHGYIRQPQEADYVLLQPAQILVLQMPSSLYWQGNHLCLSFPSRINGYSFVYEGPIVGTDKRQVGSISERITTLMTGTHQGLTPGIYRFCLYYAMPTSTLPIRDDNTDKVVKTLNGFWTGDVTTPPLKFELVTPG